MIYIGTTRANLNAWVIFVDEDALESGMPDAKAGKGWAGATTQVDTAILRMFFSWLLWAMVTSGHPQAACDTSKFYKVNLQGPANWKFCEFEYVSLSTMTRCTLKLTTILSPQQPITFNHRQLTRLRQVWTPDNYNAWRSRSPAEWQANSFFATRHPLLMVSSYGQNQELSFTTQPVHDFANQMHFKGARDYSVAVAAELTHVILSISG